MIGALPLPGAMQPVKAKRAMVVSREAHATDAGVAILRAGGNAVDAAVAVGFALAVTHPSAGNLGGGGFMLIRFADGRAAFVDFRERAPQKASHDMYLDASGKPTDESVNGWRAAGVPGTVRGLELAAKKYGTRPWKELLAPAIRLAADGFPVSFGLADSLRRAAPRLEKFPESKRIFLRGGAFYQPGEILRQPELALTLRRIAAEGSRDFYEGETARRLAAEMAAHGGLITREDLRSYQALEREPLTGSYRGVGILTAPPPSSGGIGILQMTGMLAHSDYQRTGAGSARALHFLAEAMRRYYADRAQYLGDPDFVKIPLASLLNPDYLRARYQSIQEIRATPSDDIRAGAFSDSESAETTHYSVVDQAGNAVAVTYTINGGYGSAVTVPGLGFLLNNEMDDFAVKPGVPNMFGLIQGEVNAIQPGKRPLSSMTPTILTREGKLWAVLGSPGGSRIITTVLNVLLNLVDFRMGLQDAVAFPRCHHQWRPDKLYCEAGISPDTRHLLEQRGHQLELAGSIGEVSAILVASDWLEGAADPRVEGKAAGY